MAKKTAAKKPVTKKPRRRLKRTARRSLAAVLMITAVVVAAIPVPENAAATEETPAPVEVTYAYDSKDYGGNKFSNGGVSLERPDNNDDIHKTHYIFRDGGSYRMEWKYEFMLQQVKGESKGIICGYNDTYPEELLKVPTDPIYEYYTVLDELRGGEKNPHPKRDTFKEFKDKAKDPTDTTGLYRTFTCGAEPNAEENLDDAAFQKYFPAEYQAQVTAANRYKTEKEAWDKAADDWKKANPAWTQDQFDSWKADHPEPTKTQVLTKTTADFSDADEEYVWRLYYCDTHSPLSGYVLIRVADSDRTTALNSVPTIYSYVPQRIDLADKSAENDDENGFRIAERTSFIGIGDAAFGTNDPTGASTGVQNVTNIELPDAIKYIGDYAFAGSFIHSIKMVNVENVGNYAFKACPNLGEVEFEVGVTNIGKEAFYGVQNLKRIVFPGTVKYIGVAAFAECNQLSDVDFSKLSLELTLDDYVFYNDVALNKVDFVRAGTTPPVNSDNKPYEKPDTVSVVGLGKGAFAVRGSVRGNLTEFLIPAGISENEPETLGITSAGLGVGGKGLGDFLLAGRTNLETVVMSENYGSSSGIELPSDLLFNCISLKKVVFPSTGNSCGFVSFKKDLFDTISNPDFVVWGPKYLSPSNKVESKPRESTWTAESAVSNTIPYVYFENDTKFVEVSDDIYLECIDQNGVLISCTLKPKAAIPSEGIDLVIPADVAGITVKKIGDNCFSDNTLNQAVKTLTIIDDSELREIGDSVFSGWENLQKAYIGNSVRSLGKNVFKNDKKLIDVTFNTPDSAAGEFGVGADAFLTTGLELTFHGVINENFEPYKQAIGANNYIDADRRTRICYKSLAPSSLTVMYDNASGKVTLLDYPKYEDVETILGEFYATKKGKNWKNWEKLDGSKAKTAAEFYKDWMEREYYTQYSSEQFNNKRDAFETAWKAATSAEDVYSNYDVYGPWVTPEYCASFGSSAGGGGTGGGDSGDTGNEGDDTSKAILDWLFEPITAYAMSGAPEPYFKKHPYSVFGNYENTENVYGPYQTQTGDEQDVIDATRNIIVPDGVTSIDVNGFLTAEANSGNTATYFTQSKLGEKAYTMYRTSKGVDDRYQDREKDVVGGLFSGEYEDYKASEGVDNPKETIKKGNDRLESIDLNGVTSLPQYAFDNCESLRKVAIGKDCKDIGTLPFRGCTALTNVEIAGDNQKYLVERDGDACNRIIYSRNGTAENGSSLYKIEECLETRGRDNDSSVVLSARDTLIPFVNEIAEGAFAACDFVDNVDLTDATNLSTIPKRTFMDCDELSVVKLPSSANKIEEYAFYNAPKLNHLWIPGREVSFTDDVFKDDEKYKTWFHTYADSAARRYEETNKLKYNLDWEDIGDLWEVKFFDMDGMQIGSTLSVANDTRLTRDQIPENPTKEGYVFDTWVGTGGITVEDYITGPTSFIAKYNPDGSGGPVDGKYMVEFFDGVDGQQLAGRGSNPNDGKYYVEAGKSFSEMGWPEPIHPTHAGYEAAGFSSGAMNAEGQWTSETKVTGNWTIVALYKPVAGGGTTSGGSTNTPTSGGTTSSGTTSGGTTSSKSSSSKSSSSSSSGSSTSTTSTSNTSGAGMYTVFVENGYGSGSYAPGTMVIVTAAQPAAGMRFDKWTTESNGVTLVSVSLPATTFQMPANNVSVKANFVADTTPRATTAPGTGGSSGNTGGGTTNDNGNTRVDIEKPGISNRDLATANVNGSTDNFIVKISETDEATRAVAAALTNKYGTLDNILYYAMDITLWDSTGTTQISDTTGLSVDITIPIPDSLVAYGGNNMAGAVVNGDQLESLNENFTTINGVPCIRFRATHFSPYTIYVDTGNLVEGMLDTTPKTGDPIHPKWFLSLGLACLSMILFLKRDKRKPVKVKKA